MNCNLGYKRDGTGGARSGGVVFLCEGALMRYVGVDYGTKRIGLAVCDELEISAGPLAQIQGSGSRNLMADAMAVAKMASEYDVDEYVVGLAYNMDGTVGRQGQLCQEFAQVLGQATGKKVHLFDERLSSEAAEAKLLAAGLTKKKRKARTDMLAAAIILQSFLDVKNR